MNKSVIKIKNTSFTRCTSKRLGGLIYVFQGSLLLENSSALDFTNGGISSDESHMLISDSTFTNGVSKNQEATVMCKICPTFRIERSTFQNNQSGMGGAVSIFAMSFEPIDETFAILESNFINNTAESAGAILSNDHILNIENSVFQNNTSGSNGGALILQCESFDNCRFNLTNNTFTYNSAKSDGGAISWIDIMPQLDSNQF